MNQILRQRLTSEVESRLQNDPSHDLGHTLRVLHLAEQIAQVEGADLDILVPAALFHDVIVHGKHDPRSGQSTEESAALAEKVLLNEPNFPAGKVPAVATAIRQCSYSRGIMADSLEGRILQDADRLEATGAIAVMRTYASTGLMNRPFFDPADPFCEARDPAPHRFALDLFYARLLRVETGMHTETARMLARRRTEFLRAFLQELRLELEESGSGAIDDHSSGNFHGAR